MRKGFASFSYAKPVALCIVGSSTFYDHSSVRSFTSFSLSDIGRWPIGDIAFGTAFHAIGQILLFAFSVTICNAIKRHIDGLFFFTLYVLLSVMMVYKYWDLSPYVSCPYAPPFFFFANWHAQKEDLELSVGSKATVWDLYQPLVHLPVWARMMMTVAVSCTSESCGWGERAAVLPKVWGQWLVGIDLIRGSVCLMDDRLATDRAHEMGRRSE